MTTEKLLPSSPTPGPFSTGLQELNPIVAADVLVTGQTASGEHADFYHRLGIAGGLTLSLATLARIAAGQGGVLKVDPAAVKAIAKDGCFLAGTTVVTEHAF